MVSEKLWACGKLREDREGKVIRTDLKKSHQPSVNIWTDLYCPQIGPTCQPRGFIKETEQKGQSEKITADKVLLLQTLPLFGKGSYKFQVSAIWFNLPKWFISFGFPWVGKIEIGCLHPRRFWKGVKKKKDKKKKKKTGGARKYFLSRLKKKRKKKVWSITLTTVQPQWMSWVVSPIHSVN